MSIKIEFLGQMIIKSDHPSKLNFKKVKLFCAHLLYSPLYDSFYPNPFYYEFSITEVNLPRDHFACFGAKPSTLTTLIIKKKKKTVLFFV